MRHIAILDFGSQYTHLIARLIRELNVLAKIYPSKIRAKDLPKNIAGIIISGGPQSVYAKNSLKLDAKILDLGKPILGLCYGHQLLTDILGGSVKKGERREYGKAEAALKKASALTKKISPKTIVWMSHGDKAEKLPAGFDIIASTKDCAIAGMASEERKIYGLQFHPEVYHSAEGKKIIANFVFGICSCEKNWEIDNLVDSLILKIQKQAARKNVFVLVSGGVDSNAAFSLLTRALGKDRVIGLYVDTGFMRLGETAEIQEYFKEAGFDNFKIIKASQDFFESLKNITDPEEKRSIIGQVFLDVKDEAFARLKLNHDDWLLGQGTIYPDVIESGGTDNADTIKTHHNRINEIEKMVEKGLVIEPLADFYKDEARKIGRLLNLPERLINRHPFPGPGLAIRCLCFESKVKSQKLKVDIVLKNTMPKKIKYHVLPIKSVGVQGDNRTYAYPLAVSGENNWEKLDQISRETTNANAEINRVLLLLNPGKAPQFELPKEDYTLTKKRIKLLQKIDAIVMAQIKDARLYAKIWQFPVILIPILGPKKKESIVLRPIVSREAMTADFFHLKKQILRDITEKILSTGEIDYVFYDITNKPPGTIEWE